MDIDIPYFFSCLVGDIEPNIQEYVNNNNESASSQLQTHQRQQTEGYKNPNDIFNKLLERVNLNSSDFPEIMKNLNEPYMDQILSWLLMKATATKSNISQLSLEQHIASVTINDKDSYNLTLTSVNNNISNVQQQQMADATMNDGTAKEIDITMNDNTTKEIEIDVTMNDDTTKEIDRTIATEENAEDYITITDTNENEIARYSIFDINNIENNQELKKVIETGYWVLQLSIRRIASLQNHSREDKILHSVIQFCVTDQVLVKVAKSLNFNTSPSRTWKYTDEMYINLIKARIGNTYLKYGLDAVFNFVDSVLRDLFEKLLIAIINIETGTSEKEVLEYVFSEHLKPPEANNANNANAQQNLIQQKLIRQNAILQHELTVSQRNLANFLVRNQLNPDQTMLYITDDDNTIDSYTKDSQQRYQSIIHTRWNLVSVHSDKVNDASMKAFNAQPEYYCIYKNDTSVLVEVYIGSNKFVEICSKFWKKALYEAFWVTYEKLGLISHNDDKARILRDITLVLCK